MTFDRSDAFAQITRLHARLAEVERAHERALLAFHDENELRTEAETELEAAEVTADGERRMRKTMQSRAETAERRAEQAERGCNERAAKLCDDRAVAWDQPSRLWVTKDGAATRASECRSIAKELREGSTPGSTEADS